MAINYGNSWTETEYENAIVSLISAIEGLEPKVRDIGDTKATIGYGYTFNRSDNVALWRAAGISLSAYDLSALKAIDAAPPANKTSVALSLFLAAKSL